MRQSSASDSAMLRALATLELARQARRAFDFGRGDALFEAARLDRDLEADGARRAGGDEIELVEQRAAEQVDAFEAIDEAGGGAQKQAQAARHDRAREAVVAATIGREHEIVIAPGVEDLGELGRAESARRRESR